MSLYHSPRSNRPDGIIAGIGCLWLILGVAWVGFLIWAIFSVVTWLTSK